MNNCTIIHGNCWNGAIYKSHFMWKKSPTSGAFIVPSDCVSFCAYLARYFIEQVGFFLCDGSKWKGALFDDNSWTTSLITLVGDVKLKKLRCCDVDSAKCKWDSCVRMGQTIAGFRSMIRTARLR